MKCEHNWQMILGKLEDVDCFICLNCNQTKWIHKSYKDNEMTINIRESTPKKNDNSN